MKHTRPKRGKKRVRIVPILCTVVLFLLAVGSVALAYILRPTTPENPPITSESSSEISLSVTDTDKYSTSSDFKTDITDTATSDTDSESMLSTTEATTDTQINITTIIPPPADGTTKRVAFTFDDGPHYKYTREIADAFVEYGGKCTFFVVGNRISGPNGEAMGYAASLGHEVGSHSYTHVPNFKNCEEEVYLSELQNAHDAIKNAIGIAPTLMRPPGGNITKDRVAYSAYSIIMWNVDPHDWQYKKESEENVTTIVNNVLSAVSEGDIVLLHDIYKNTADAVRIILPILKEAGYEFVTVSELLGEHKAPGIRYSQAY